QVPIYRVALVHNGNQSVQTETIPSTDASVPVFREYIGDADREIFCMMMLDARNKIIGLQTIGVGSLLWVPVGTAEVFKPAILCNAPRIILCHNHLSDDPTPSEGDIRLFGEIQRAGEHLGIDVADEVILAFGGRHACVWDHVVDM